MNEQDKKVPTLRFKGFANDWEQRKLSEISDPIRSYSYTRKYETNSVTGFKYIHYGDIHTGNAKEIDDPNELPSIVKGNYSKLTSGDIVVADASEDYKGIADAAILLNPGTFSVIAGLHTIAFRPNTELVFPMFVYYILQTNSFKHYGYHVGTGLKVFGISSKLFFNYLASYPSLTEQQNISKLIKLLENLITLQQRKLDLLNQLKKGLLQKMFADKDSKQPILRFNGFTDDWEQRKVSDIFTVTRGQVLATTKISEVKTNEMCFPVYSSQTKNNGLMGYYNKYLFNTAITWTTDGANAGTVNYREGKFYSTNVNGVLLSDDGYANKAIAEILDRVAWRYVSRVGNPKLMNNVMSNIKISIPSSFEEQNAISEFLTKFDHLIALQQRKQNHLKLLKKSLLQQMFM